MKIKPLKQRDAEACGPTCIKMIVAYFGLPHTAREIAAVSKYKQRGGLSNTELVSTLRRLGLRVKTKHEATWQDLQKHNKPGNVVVLSWMLKGYIGHFSVLDKVTKTHISLADPEIGKIVTLPKLVFLRLWFDYDEKWYPMKNTDIQLRWMAVVSQ